MAAWLNHEEEDSQSEDGLIDAATEPLFGNMLLLEGWYPNPARMVPRIQMLLEAATRPEREQVPEVLMDSPAPSVEGVEER